MRSPPGFGLNEALINFYPLEFLMLASTTVAFNIEEKREDVGLALLRSKRRNERNEMKATIRRSRRRSSPIVVFDSEGP